MVAGDRHQSITHEPFPAFLMSAPLHISTQEANNVWMRELDGALPYREVSA